MSYTYKPDSCDDLVQNASSVTHHLRVGNLKLVESVEAAESRIKYMTDNLAEFSGYLDECLLSNLFDLGYSEYELAVVRAYVEDFAFLHEKAELYTLLATIESYTCEQYDVLIDTLEMFAGRDAVTPEEAFTVERERTSRFKAVKDITLDDVTT